jgi:ubiquitin carboxyl-terminal hydrolase L5
MRGLCIASSHTLRQVHNSFARCVISRGIQQNFEHFLSPADIRASLSKIADTTMKNPPKSPKKAKGRSKGAPKSKKAAPAEPAPDQYHFLSYVPYQGRVWEMDGLKSAPLECAELDSEEPWLEAVRPALRGRIEALSRAGDIRFNLLAIVPCAYQAKMREFELVKREITAIERRLGDEYGENWKETVRLFL